MRRYPLDYDDWVWYGGGMDEGESDVTFGYGVGGFAPGNHGGRRMRRPRPWRPRRAERERRHPPEPYDRAFEDRRRPPPPVPPRAIRGRSPEIAGRDRRWPLDPREPLVREIREEMEDLVVDYLRSEPYGEEYARTVGLRTHGPGDRWRGVVRRAFGRGYDRTW